MNNSRWRSRDRSTLMDHDGQTGSTGSGRRPGSSPWSSSDPPGNTRYDAHRLTRRSFSAALPALFVLLDGYSVAKSTWMMTVAPLVSVEICLSHVQYIYISHSSTLFDDVCQRLRSSINFYHIQLQSESIPSLMTVLWAPPTLEVSRLRCPSPLAPRRGRPSSAPVCPLCSFQQAHD